MRTVSEKGVYKRLKSHTQTSVILEDDHGTYEYTFPQEVLGPEATQQQVWDTVAREMVENVMKLDGYNALLFAYGQTGTG
jgi:hypothetical protein